MPLEETAPATTACGMLSQENRMPTHRSLLAVVRYNSRSKSFCYEILCVFAYRWLRLPPSRLGNIQASLILLSAWRRLAIPFPLHIPYLSLTDGNGYGSLTLPISQRDSSGHTPSFQKKCSHSILPLGTMMDICISVSSISVASYFQCYIHIRPLALKLL